MTRCARTWPVSCRSQRRGDGDAIGVDDFRMVLRDGVFHAPFWRSPSLPLHQRQFFEREQADRDQHEYGQSLVVFLGRNR